MTHIAKRIIRSRGQRERKEKERRGNNLGKEIKSAALHWSMDSK